MSNTTLSPYGRGTCPVCGRDSNLTKRGKLRVHVDADKPGEGWGRPLCAGNGKQPSEVTA